VEFYDRALNRKDWAAASELIGPNYIQHNPNAADGPEGLRAHVEMLRADFPESRGEIQASYVDGDRVILHVHSRRTPDDRGSAIVDIFRIADGLVVEHWDVVQPIPETAGNGDALFYGQ
jgi:predicted SnoaL-like aldol condensation-catalyzing enzyme